MNSQFESPNLSDFPQLQLYLDRCLDLARKPGSAVSPNPRVGAIVVWKDRIIGEGAHLRFGGAHAEVNAIQSVIEKDLLRESTLFISLEPCNHHGKTPPCTQLILEMGIPHVVVGSLDPNPLMQGKSIEFLKSKGVRVDLVADSAPFIELNRHFWVNQRARRPYILLKWAESADGFIAGLDVNGNPEPRAISGSSANRHFHWLRHELQAIWIGKNTLHIDNPSLTTRLWPGNNPLRIVSNSHLELSEATKILEGGPTLVVNGIVNKQEGHVQYWKVDDPHDLEAVLRRMYAELNIGSILVEGGRQLTQSFVDSGLWDEIQRCVSPIRLGAGVPAARIPLRVLPSETLKLGADMLMQYLPS